MSRAHEVISDSNNLGCKMTVADMISMVPASFTGMVRLTRWSWGCMRPSTASEASPAVTERLRERQDATRY